MTQTAQEIETPEQAENRLWCEYLATLIRYHEVRQMQYGAWRIYVTTRSETAWKNWSRYMDLSQSLREQERMTHRAWEKVAYPLYDWPLDDEDD